MMVRILTIGDFHGKIPYKLKKKIDKLVFDVIISPGDFGSFHERKLFFKHAYGKEDVKLADVIGQKKVNKFILQNEADAEKVISYLESFKKPLFVVTGNTDYAGQNDIGGEDDTPKEYKKLTLNFLNKLKIPVLDFAKQKFNEYELVGYPRSSYPGIYTRTILSKKPHYKKRASKQEKDYMDHKKRMEKLFTNPQKTIFISHNTPYRTKLDKIGAYGDESVRGQHYGSALTKELIKKYQPRLVIAGHMHENAGKIRIGKTIVVNPGAAVDGRAALIELTDKQVRVNFIKV
jgi:Icc-related predicted phosphoesterase